MPWLAAAGGRLLIEEYTSHASLCVWSIKVVFVPERESWLVSERVIPEYKGVVEGIVKLMSASLSCVKVRTCPLRVALVIAPPG
jgi:hypothetical protein